MNKKVESALFVSIDGEYQQLFSSEQVIEKLQQENQQLKDRINQTKNTIETTISIIKQQPSSNKELDLYFINQLERYLNLLKGDKE